MLAVLGDWTRINAISKEDELWLQQVAEIVGAFHVACAAAAVAISSRQGERWVPRAAKVLVVGPLALMEVLLLQDDREAK